jgi:predicted transcriptional regulator
VDEANKVFAPTIVSRFIVTHGDEFQGLLNVEGACNVLQLYDFFRKKLAPVNLRLGIGVGTLNTDLNKKNEAIGMDGPAWYRAKESLDKTAAKSLHLYISFSSKIRTDLINLLINILMKIEEDWHLTHRQVIEMTKQSMTQEQIAEKLGITQGAISQRLKHARWRNYQQLQSILPELLSGTVLLKDEKLINMVGNDEAEVEIMYDLNKKTANLLSDIFSDIEKSWRASHHEVIALTEKGMSQEQVAVRLGITQGAVSQRLKHARLHTYQQLTAVKELISAAAASKEETAKVKEEVAITSSSNK